MRRPLCAQRRSIGLSPFLEWIRFIGLASSAYQNKSLKLDRWGERESLAHEKKWRTIACGHLLLLGRRPLFLGADRARGLGVQALVRRQDATSQRSTSAAQAFLQIGQI